MGYFRDANTGKLMCDMCGSRDGVRRVRCPFNYCASVALCPECRKTRKDLTSKEAHRKYGCEEGARKAQERYAREQELIASGAYLRRSALGHGDRVKVFFKSKYGECCAWMPKETYRAIPGSFPATIEDYQAHGSVVMASNTNLYDAELVEVTA